MENVIEIKSFDFAIRIVNLYKYLTGIKKEYVLSKQLLRSGTSISAALTAGACAQLFQWGIVENNMLYLNTTDLKNLLIRGAVRDEDRTYPNPVYGYGVLEVYQALSRLRGN